MALKQSKKTIKKKTQETSSFGTFFHTNFQLKFQNEDWYKIGTNYKTNFEPKQQAHFPFTFFSWTLIFLPTSVIFIIFSFNPNSFVLFFIIMIQMYRKVSKKFSSKFIVTNFHYFIQVCMFKLPTPAISTQNSRVVFMLLKAWIVTICVCLCSIILNNTIQESLRLI